MTAQTIPFKPRRFRTAVEHYLQGRPPYAPRLFERVAVLCGLGPSHRVLDLGCGPGQIALALAPFAKEVTAVDPEPEMLRIAAEAAAHAGAAVRFVEGSFYDIGPQLGTFRLAAMGRAFHWMDRADTLMRLDAMIEPEGAVLLVDDDHPELPDNAWLKSFNALIERYAEGDADRVTRKSPGWVRHEALLLDSPFGRLEKIAVIDRRRTPVERFVDRALSLSSTTRERLGERADQLAAEVRETMSKTATDGLVTEAVESSALIAWRGHGSKQRT
jgi:SAM-dependent methyltransferase